MCELEHHRSHKKEVHLFLKSWKFMGCCTILFLKICLKGLKCFGDILMETISCVIKFMLIRSDIHARLSDGERPRI